MGDEHFLTLFVYIPPPRMNIKAARLGGWGLIFRFPHARQEVELERMADPEDLGLGGRGQVRDDELDGFEVLVRLA
jgi:hypothetical protein